MGMTEIRTLEILSLYRRDGDRITNSHLRRLAQEGWSLVCGVEAHRNATFGCEYTFERWVLDASTQAC